MAYLDLALHIVPAWDGVEGRPVEPEFGAFLATLGVRVQAGFTEVAAVEISPECEVDVFAPDVRITVARVPGIFAALEPDQNLTLWAVRNLSFEELALLYQLQGHRKLKSYLKNLRKESKRSCPSTSLRTSLSRAS